MSALKSPISGILLNPIQDRSFWGFSRMRREPKGHSLLNLSHIFSNYEDFHTYTLPKEDPEII